jgi:predicted nucleic acid-binding Zn ribbon protein
MKKSNENSLREVINQLIDTYKLRDKLNEVKILRCWEEVMGKAIANRTVSISMHSQELYIRVNSAPLREELLYQRDKIRELMNKELGGPYIKEVRIN